MVYYPNSPAGYLNPVAIDRIEHPEYEAMVCENTTMRVVQYLYPIIKNTVEMLENLCKETDAQVPTDLTDNLDFLKNIFNTQVDFHPRNLMGEEASENLNAKLSLHEEWSQHEGNEHHSIMNWSNPYGSAGTIQQAPPPPAQPMPYGYAPPQPQNQRSLMNPFSWFGGGAVASIPAWQLPPPQLDTLQSGEQYYSGAGGPPPMAQQSGNSQLPAGAIGWSVGTGQPIDFNGQTVQSTGERLVNTALTKFL